MESAENIGKVSASARFEFGGIVFDNSSCELWRGSDRLKLRRQPAMLLALLVARAGQVVSREEIRQLIWKSDTHVDFEQGINWCVRQLRKALNDDADEPRFIETLPKQGYRFLAPCSIVTTAAGRRRSREFSLPWKAALGAVVATVLVAGATYQRVERRAPTVLLLPIDNFSGDASVDSVANASTDYLIASLGANPGQLRVIDRPTAAKFKSTGECIIKMGRQLSADYVFIGSIEASGAGPRLSGGLFRVADNTQVWTTAAGVNPLSGRDISEIPKAIVAALR